METKVTFLAVFMVIGACVSIVSGSCDECDDVTELCVQSEDGSSTDCQCRPSLYRPVENESCQNTKSYTTIADFVDDFEWNENYKMEGSEEYQTLSNEVCEDFDSVFEASEEVKEGYYGCELIAFSESADEDDPAYGVVVLSLFGVNQQETSASLLQEILERGLPQTTYMNNSIITTETNECDLEIDDCHVLATCTDTGVEGFRCECSDTTEDASPEGLPGRECQVRSFGFIVAIAAGASIVVFIIMVFIVACVSTHTTIGKPASQIEEERQEKLNRNTRETDKIPLDPQGEDGEDHDDRRAKTEGVSNGGFIEPQTPETIFDVNDDQMARLAQIHLAIERHTRPASALPVAQSDIQMQMSGLPSVDYAPEQRTAAAYQNVIRQKQQKERASLERLPSSEYLTPMSPGEELPPSRQNPYGIKSKTRLTSSTDVDEMNGSPYSSRLPTHKYNPRSPTSPPTTPAPEPHLSRQSSSVFLPSSPRTSRDFGGEGNSYNYRY